jgi:hypothetical protein
METLHSGDLAMEFKPEPDRAERRLTNPREWRTYHSTLHRLYPEKYPHDHEEDAVETKPLNYHEKQEPVWVVRQGVKLVGVAVAEAGASQLPGLDKSLPFDYERTTLFRPSLAPIYGGPTLLEALWNEMDRLMEGLMTKADAEDGGDRFRAAELAWVLAIVTNAYQPDVNAIRAEAVARWNRANS